MKIIKVKIRDVKMNKAKIIKRGYFESDERIYKKLFNA